MPIDLDKALGAVLPAVDYRWNEDTLMLYALGAGVGIGQDQTSPQVLQYTFENGLRALPTFGVVPSFPMLMGLMNVPGPELQSDDAAARRAVPRGARDADPDERQRPRPRARSPGSTTRAKGRSW